MSKASVIKRRLALDSDQAGNLKGHIYVTTAGLVILEKITDAVLANSLSWGQLTVAVLILLALAAVSYFDVGSAKYFGEALDAEGDAPAEGPEQERDTLQEALRRHSQ